MNATRRSLIGAGIGLAPFATIAKDAPLKTESSKDACAELESAVRSGFAPGLVGLIESGGNVDVMPLGRIAVDGPPMRRDTIFRIASMSKPITAAALIMLIDDGKLRRPSLFTEKVMAANRMSRLEIFIGTWNTTGEVLETEGAPAVTLSATDTYRWLPGRSPRAAAGSATSG